MLWLQQHDNNDNYNNMTMNSSAVSDRNYVVVNKKVTTPTAPIAQNTPKTSSIISTEYFFSESYYEIMTTYALLRAAKGFSKDWDWVQKDGAVDANGGWTSFYSESAVGFDMCGGILRSISVVIGIRSNVRNEIYRRSINRVESVLDTSPFVWNDEWTTTKAMVIDVLFLAAIPPCQVITNIERLNMSSYKI